MEKNFATIWPKNHKVLFPKRQLTQLELTYLFYDNFSKTHKTNHVSCDMFSDWDRDTPVVWGCNTHADWYHDTFAG